MKTLNFDVFNVHQALQHGGSSVVLGKRWLLRHVQRDITNDSTRSYSKGDLNVVSHYIAAYTLLPKYLKPGSDLETDGLSSTTTPATIYHRTMALNNRRMDGYWLVRRITFSGESY
ncbi:hypothetical protein TNCV_3886241 [Trichonephila clavipes]|nr:hypothetical protein TNCV_3886241 [Trichonephila clavipes]